MSDVEQLYELHPDGADIADDERFQRGNKNPDRSYYEPYLQETELEADVETLEDKIAEDVVGEYEVGSAKIDAEIAPTVHRTIDISRRDAARDRIWHYLAVVRLPDFVWYRWPREASNRTQTSMREKFLGTHRDIYSNAFHRLWWMAELTYDSNLENPYERTRLALGNQSLANKIFDRGFSRSRPVVAACIDVLHDEPTSVIEATTLRLNHAMTAVSIEGLLDEGESLRDHVEQIREDVKS